MMHRRLLILGATFAIVSAAGCRQKAAQPVHNAAPQATAETAPEPSTSVPLPQVPVDRQQLIFGALKALSAAALAQDDRDAQKQLDGREFELHLRFGCPGAAANASRGWSYDEKNNVLRAHVVADLAADSVPASDLLLKGYDGAVGFLIDKPLLLTSGCPKPQLGPLNSVEPAIAVAQLFTRQDSRVQRPQRIYDITKKIDVSDRPTEGLDLVISGRLAGLSDERPIHCGFAEGPPACIISAKFDRVSIRNPVDGAVLGEWSQW